MLPVIPDEIFKVVISLVIFIAVVPNQSHADSIFFCGLNITAKTTTMRLKRDIFCGYDKSSRPVKHPGDPVTLDVNLVPRHISFDADFNVLTIHGVLHLIWSDEHLTWDSTKYDGLTFIHVPPTEIWKPDLTVLDSADHRNDIPFVTKNALISNNGDVFWTPSAYFLAYCDADLTRWPFDSHKCSLILGSWHHWSNELYIRQASDYLGVYLPSKAWKLVGSSLKVSVFNSTNNLSYQYINFDFDLERHASNHAATVIIPAIVLSMLTLITFWIDSTCLERLILGTINILIHCLYLQYLGNKLPPNGDSSPLIVLFFRDSLLMVGLSVVIAVILGFVSKTQLDAPNCIVAVYRWLLGSSVGQYLVLGKVDPKAAAEESGGEDKTTLVTTTAGNTSKEWIMVALFFDRLCFLLYLIVFFILIVALV